MTNDNKSLSQSFTPCKHLSIPHYIVLIFAEYIHFYNFERISLKIGLTPLEIRGKTA